MTLVYVDIFWLLIVLLSAEWLLQLVKRKRIMDLTKLSKNVDYLNFALWYFLAALTGSYAYALEVPPIIDTLIVVAFLLVTTTYRLHLRSRF
jgi:heme A synthase